MLNDIDSLIRIEALQSFAECIDYMSKEVLLDNFVSVIKNIYLDQNEECIQTLAMSCGKIIAGFKDKGVLEEDTEVLKIIKDFY